jgi:hypothetical protein
MSTRAYYWPQDDGRKYCQSCGTTNPSNAKRCNGFGCNRTLVRNPKSPKPAVTFKPVIPVLTGDERKRLTRTADLARARRTLDKWVDAVLHAAMRCDEYKRAIARLERLLDPNRKLPTPPDPDARKRKRRTRDIAFTPKDI